MATGKGEHTDKANDADPFFDTSREALSGAAHKQLSSVIERIERLNEDKDALMDDMKEVYSEAKGNGFDVKILRIVIRLRRMDSAKRQEQDALVDLYLSAIGGL